MKKLFSKLTVLVLALLMCVSMAACGDDKMVEVNSVPEAVAGAAETMVKKDGFTVSAEITGVLPELAPSGFKLDAKVKKADTDYDLDATLTYALGTFQMQNRFIKKGNALYSGSDLAGYTQTPVETADIAGALAKVQEVAGNIDLGELNRGKDSYTLSGELEFGSVLETVRTTLVGMKDVPVGGLLASLFGDDYTAEDLIADIEDILADKNTIKGTAEKLDAFFAKTGIPVTVKQIADPVLQQAGITAQNVYDEFVKPLLGNAGLKPEANESAYDYVMRVGQFVKLETVWEKADIGMSLADARAQIAAVLGNDKVTVEVAWDTVADMLDEAVAPIFGMIADSDAYMAILESGESLFAMANLEKMQITAGKVTLDITLNGNDLSLKSVEFTFKCEVKYDGASLIKQNLRVSASFAYDKVDEIKAPTKIIDDGNDEDFDFGGLL